MPCYHPITAYQCVDGEVVFVQLRRYDISKTLQLPCGQCIGCRLEKSRQWAVRCMHEAAMHENNCFITLTYNDEHVPERGKLQHKDVQDFLKRYRKKHNIRYYMAGEYGPELSRPHYHLCIFGHDFEDKLYLKTTPAGEKIYTSVELEKLWPWGYSSVANLTFESAAYVARYCVSKITGDAAEEHYKRFDYLGEYQLPPEYNQMSRKPGLGQTWLKKYTGDIYNRDTLIVNGHETKPPKYYDKLFEKFDPERFEEIKTERIIAAIQRYPDNTESRLLVKEAVAIAKTSTLKRGKV